MSESATNIYLGLALKVKDQVVNLRTNTPINRVKEKGLLCTIAKPVRLGTVKGAFNDITASFGIKDGQDNYKWENIKDAVNGVPVINTLISLLGDANISIDNLDINLPPESATDKTNKYNVALSMVWDDLEDKDVGRIFGEIKIQGFYFRATNMSSEEIKAIRNQE